MNKSFINDFQLTKYFNLKEFSCPSTDCVRIHRDLILMLQNLRMILDKPIRITSGFRTREHNISVGGSPNSLHMYGKAADFIVEETFFNVRHAIVTIGFDYYKYYDNTTHWHVDIRNHK